MAEEDTGGTQPPKDRPRHPQRAEKSAHRSAWTWLWLERARVTSLNR